MTRFYLGYSGENRRWEIFTADRPADATPEETGYDEVEGPYDSKQDAQEALDEKRR